VNGIYVFQTSPRDSNILPVRPAVYVAEAQTPEQAREIHRRLWNLGQAPFLIVVLPNQVRVYKGFEYSRELENADLLEDGVSLDARSIRDRLADFCAESINTGLLWQKRAKAVTPDQRVDKRLLRNLRELSNHLRAKEGLKSELAHALIGKYVYIRYLSDRGLLSAEWLKQQHNVNLDHVLSRQAKV